ncbi:MAG: cobalt transporter CbiM [Actinomycetota bacterium]
MHIPDGYLSPQTSAAMFAAAAPFWYTAFRKIRKTFEARRIPLLAIAAAFTFIVMMFNVPLPGGTTGHAVGSALVAIVLGPWAAVIAVSVALVVQAIFFGDGGILAIGANCFNMAIVLPFVSYYLYRWLIGFKAIEGRFKWLAAGIAGYVGLNVAALCTAIEFGIQPALFHTANGAALYAPYPLNVAIPAMMIPHLLVAGIVEAVTTGGILLYLEKSGSLEPVKTKAAKISSTAKLWIGIAIMAILTPIGLLAPGTAWGEWGGEEVKTLVGYVPHGLDKLSSLWSAPLPDYSLSGWENAPFLKSAGIYIISAILGIAVVGGLVFIISKLVLANKHNEGGVD